MRRSGHGASGRSGWVAGPGRGGGAGVAGGGGGARAGERELLRRSRRAWGGRRRVLHRRQAGRGVGGVRDDAGTGRCGASRARTIASGSRPRRRYAPQYGGYCAWAVSQGYTADGDPENWTIVDGRLFLNYDARGTAALGGRHSRAWWRKADANWPRLLAAGSDARRRPATLAG